MKGALPSKAAIRERAASELKEFALIAGYLFIVFGALAFLKSAILQAQGVNWAPWGFAVIKAVLAAKFILLGHALHIGEGRGTKPLIWQTLHKSIAFLIFVTILLIIEESVVGLLHGKTFSQSIAEIGGGTLEQSVATALIVFLAFLPMFAFAALSEVMGKSALLRTFFVERTQFAAVNGPPQH